MKKTLAMAAFMTLGACSGGEDREATNSTVTSDAASVPEAKPMDLAARQALAQRIADDENRVTKMTVTGDNWRASVADDGTRQDGFAMYLCEVLREDRANGPNVVVNVVDPKDDSRVLGSSGCA